MGLFDKLESKLEQGVNGAFARAFRAEVQPVEIASGIRRAMDDRASAVKKGKRPIVPNLFTIELSHADYERLSGWGRELDDELIAAAQEHADEQRYLPGGPFTIVLTQNDSLETGVFHLRPATARAAEAQAEANAHPRPRYADDPVNDPAGFRSREPSAQKTTGSSSGSGWGQRIKGYLRGDTASAPHSPAQDDIATQQAVAHRAGEDADGYAGYSNAGYDHAGYDDAGYADDRYRERGDWRQQAATGTSAAGSLGAAFGAATQSASPQVEPATEQSRPTYPGGFTPSKRHAWDDDDDLDDSMADGTGNHAGATGADHTAAVAAPAQPARPRKMSPKERPWLKLDGQRIPLMSAITVLGRDDDADVIIDDPGVSRRHSEIRITHDGPHLVMSIRDLGSTNGTFVNGEQVDSEHVHDGDALTIGRTRMSIHLGDRA